jgi:lipid A 3-O-deacylase
MQMIRRQIACTLIGLITSLSIMPVAQAFDSASIEVGTGNRTLLTRLGLQSKWENRWWQSNGTHIGGYWDASLMYWRSNRYQGIAGVHQNIGAIGITPVFRFQADTLKGSYAEAAVGAHYFSDIYENNGRRFSTKFQFGDHIGVGYVFANGVDLSLKIQHFSNGGIKRPNNGANFISVGTSYSF